MSLQQYNLLMSNLLKKKYTLAKLREKLEGRKGKMCRSCKGSGYLACNCRNKKEGEKGTMVPQNKFEVLGSRMMQCGVKEKMIRRYELNVSSAERKGTSVESAHYGKRRKGWHVWQSHKRRTNKRNWHAL